VNSIWFTAGATRRARAALLDGAKEVADANRVRAAVRRDCLERTPRVEPFVGDGPMKKVQIHVPSFRRERLASNARSAALYPWSEFQSFVVTKSLVARHSRFEDRSADVVLVSVHSRVSTWR